MDKYDIKLNGRDSEVSINGEKLDGVISANIEVNVNSPLPILTLQVYLADYNVKVVPVPVSFTSTQPETMSQTSSPSVEQD